MKWIGGGNLEFETHVMSASFLSVAGRDGGRLSNEAQPIV